MPQVVLAFFVILVLFLSFDEPLNPEVEKIVDLSKVYDNDKSQAFTYLLGFLVDEKSDPLVAGYQALKIARQLEDSYFRAEQELLSQSKIFQDGPSIPLPEADELCRFSEVKCLEYFFLGDYNSEGLLAKYSILLERYLKLLSFNDYKNLFQAIPIEPSLPTLILTEASRLRIIYASSYFKVGEVEIAKSILRENINDLRKYLSQSDDVIKKLVFISAISESIDALFFISLIKPELFEELPLITADEESIKLYNVREFVGFYQMIKNIEKSIDVANKGKFFSLLIAKLRFKPNMTINRGYKSFKEISSFSGLDYQGFLDEINYFRSKQKEKTNSYNKFRNLLGSELYELIYGYDSVRVNSISSVKNLGLKLYLFNEIAIDPSMLKNVKSIQEPFLGGYAFYLKDERKICFDSVFGSHHNSSSTCLNAIY